MNKDLAAQEVSGDFKIHGVFVGKDAFYECIDTIWEWIDISSVTGQLMKHGLVRNRDTSHCIKSESIRPRERVYNLLYEIAPQAGSYGFHLLYMCIRDAKELLGNQEAADLLKQLGASTLPPLVVGDQLSSVPTTVPLPPQQTTAPVSSGEASVQNMSTTVDTLQTTSSQPDAIVRDLTAGVDRLLPLSPSTQLSPVPVADSVPLPPQLITTPPLSSGEGSTQNMSTADDGVGRRVAAQPGKMPKTRSRIGAL